MQYLSMNLAVQRFVQTDGEALLHAIRIYVGHLNDGEQDAANAYLLKCQGKSELVNVGYSMPNTEAREYAMQLFKLHWYMGYTPAFTSKWIKQHLIKVYGGVSHQRCVKEETIDECTEQILCEITEYLVNMTLSLFTPTNVFTMDKDDIFNKYKKQNDAKDVTMDAGTRNNAEGCWKWMTSREAQEKTDRLKPLIETMMPKAIADEIDELLGKPTNHFMVPRSTEWEGAYDEYVENVKKFVGEKYSTDLCEDANQLKVNQTILRKIEWVTMKHRGRQEQPFPILTKSLLPRLADILFRVQNAIAEVSCLY